MSDHVWVVVALVAIGCAHDIPTAPAATLENKSFPEYNNELLTRKAMIFQNPFFSAENVKEWVLKKWWADGPCKRYLLSNMAIWCYLGVS